MRPSGMHLYKRVCPSVAPSVSPSVGESVGPSVCYACAKTAFLGCLQPRWDTTLILNDWLTCFEFVRLSVHPSLYMKAGQHYYSTISKIRTRAFGALTDVCSSLVSLLLSFIYDLSLTHWSFLLLHLHCTWHCDHDEDEESRWQRGDRSDPLPGNTVA